LLAPAVHQGVAVFVHSDVVEVSDLMISLIIDVVHQNIVAVTGVLLPGAILNLFDLSILVEAVLDQEVCQFVPGLPEGLVAFKRLVLAERLILDFLEVLLGNLNLADEFLQVLVLKPRLRE
jgi:hypothetical protein